MQLDKIYIDNLTNIIKAIIISSCIIIILTTGASNQNSLYGLIFGYVGLFISLFGVVILQYINVGIITALDSIPFIPVVMLLIIIGMTIFYLNRYFRTISRGEVPTYYTTLSITSFVLIITQLFTLYNSNLLLNSNKEQNSANVYMYISILGLLGVLNYIFALTSGIVLKYYSTQG